VFLYFCKKRNRSHTQTHNKNNTTHETTRTPHHTTRTTPQTNTRRTTPLRTIGPRGAPGTKAVRDVGRGGLQAVQGPRYFYRDHHRVRPADGVSPAVRRRRCIYIYLSIYISIYINIHTYIYIYAYIYLYLYISLDLYAYIFICCIHVWYT